MSQRHVDSEEPLASSGTPEEPRSYPMLGLNSARSPPFHFRTASQRSAIAKHETQTRNEAAANMSILNFSALNCSFY
ncbi:hypothetical protein L5515_005254 [Caenorhabditis briggsae]|uniref:Uncharacterized protein n=1 Tax=Caenorhabditis briggsae TaxID=6238 RepID=A0AAE9EQ03_CAEBR|nr:hypothetical protein L5515_005254 [Caenorhabditis briggsae]